MYTVYCNRALAMCKAEPLFVTQIHFSVVPPDIMMTINDPPSQHGHVDKSVLFSPPEILVTVVMITRWLKKAWAMLTTPRHNDDSQFPT